jgi:hypothetical protein
MIGMIAATTSAVTASSALSIPLNTQGYAWVIIAAPGLAGVEEVDIYAMVEGVTMPVPNVAGDGQAKLTATVPALAFMGGPCYRAAKDATVASVPVLMFERVGAAR